MAADNRTKPWLIGVEGDAGKTLIESNKRFIQVVAGPGSGKTFGLKRRVERLVKGDRVRASAIFVGTFTRAIREEFALALAPSAPTKKTEDRVHVETLHSAAFEMLRDHPAAHPGRKFRFLLEHEEATMLYDLEEITSELDFNGRKDAMRKVESYWSGSGALEDDRFRGAMVAWLEQHEAMHVNEVVYIALNAMELGDLPIGAYTHVVVDEYQDLTSAEQTLVERLRADDGCLMVLGDDDQSIYRFRHNHPGGISEFPADKNGAEIERLTIAENRRCGEVIVNLANKMMAAAGSAKPPMVSRRGEVGEVSAVYWPTLDSEIEGLADYVKGQPDQNFLILVTRREIGYLLRDKIGANAWTSFHEEALRIDLVRERFALASLIANEDDPVALRAWFGFSSAGPKPATSRNAVAVRSLRGHGLAGRALIDAIVEGRVRPIGSGQLAVKRRAAEYTRLKSETTSLDLDEVIKYVFDSDLANFVEDPTKQRHAYDDLTLLRDSALQIASRLTAPTLLRVVDRLRYRISTRQPLLDVEPNVRVRIMTLHGAKGLEADTIIVAGLADEILPGRDAKDAAEAEEIRREQRRLLYVAITRAKKRLVLSWPKAMRYADASRLKARTTGNKFRLGDELMVGLGSCRFIPAGLSSVAGRAWLETQEMPSDR